MHICFAVSAMNCGGAERVVATLSNEMINKGHIITIIMVSVDKRVCFYDLDDRVKLVALCENQKGKTNPIKRVELLKRALKNIQPDVVLGFLPHICVYTWLALKDSKIPYILSERNDPHQYSIVYQILCKIAFKQASGCVFQTHDAINWYRKQPKETDKVIFNSVGLSYIPELKSNEVKKKSILFVGRLDEQKNYKMLIGAFEKFLSSCPEYVLDVYGDGPEKDQFMSLITSYKLEDSIKYHGRSSTWHRDEYNAGMYVSTSDYEGMSNSLEEAASLGIPCVATNCPIGGSFELAEVFDNIALCPVDNEDEFVSEMIKATKKKCCFTGINPRVEKNNIVNEWLELISIVRRKG